MSPQRLSHVTDASPVVIQACADVGRQAAVFHTYYNRHRVLHEDDLRLTRARLYLIGAVKKVIRNGLALLGVSAPDSM